MSDDFIEPGADANEPAPYQALKRRQLCPEESNSPGAQAPVASLPQRGEDSSLDWKVAFGRCAAALAARLHEIRRLRHENAELEKALQRAGERIAILERQARRPLVSTPDTNVSHVSRRDS